MHRDEVCPIIKSVLHILRTKLHQGVLLIEGDLVAHIIEGQAILVEAMHCHALVLCVCRNALLEHFRLFLEFLISLLTVIQVQVVLMYLIDIFFNCLDFFIKLVFGEVIVLLHLFKVADLARDRVATQEFDRSRPKLTSKLQD